MKPEALPTNAKDMFCYGIYTASHVVNRAYTPHLKRQGLTYPQYITLTLLWEQDGQKVTELSTQLRMKTSTLTPLLKRLEVRGHLTRSRGKQDGREVIVHLTTMGRELQKLAPDVTGCMVEGTSLTHDELTALQGLLQKLSEGLEDTIFGSQISG
ncbi:MAG: DNA-binding MarR family transcriptional regulator [Candidatus Azotimanducaceae bacterium]|jgi:DNA-binding MarR family transcriptional regulator